jgi:type IV fimbrial biogenesis protein FimT
MHNTKPVTRQHPARGVTLIETLCVVSIVGTSVGLAAPGLSSWRDQQALLGAAAQLETDIQYARSQAVALNTVVRLSSRTGNDGSCYVVHSGPDDTCSCTPQDGAMCTGSSAVWRQAALPATGRVQLTSRNVSIAFDPEHGTVTPATTFRLQAGNGRALHQVVNIMGRVRSCSPDNAPGFKAC